MCAPEVCAARMRHQRIRCNLKLILAVVYALYLLIVSIHQTKSYLRFLAFAVFCHLYRACTTRESDCLLRYISELCAHYVLQVSFVYGRYIKYEKPHADVSWVALGHNETGFCKMTPKLRKAVGRRVRTCTQG